MLIPGLNIEALPGTFLLVFNHECDSHVQVCQVVEATASSNLSVCWWFDNTILGTIVQSDTRQPLISSQYFNLVNSTLKEATKTAVVKDLNLSCINDIAFVFHAYDFQNTWVNCSGMSSVFLLVMSLISMGVYMKWNTPCMHHFLEIKMMATHLVYGILSCISRKK